MGVSGLDPDKIAPTVGLNSKLYTKLELATKETYIVIVGKVDIKSSRINFWDLGGQKDLQSIWERYYSECHAIVFVVDSTDPVRLDDCRDTFGKNKIMHNQVFQSVHLLIFRKNDYK
jgi:ADP-ribosylation factor related protein 1